MNVYTAVTRSSGATPRSRRLLSQDVALAGDPLELGAQLADLGALGRSRRLAGLGLAGLAHPVPDRRIVQAHLPGDLRDLAARRLDHRDDLGFELRGELPARPAGTLTWTSTLQS